MQRFWTKVNVAKPSECWLWTAGKSKFGYGRLQVEGKARYAHRVSWELHHGPIAKGLCVCHTCDNPLCVNPSHLWLGTTQENTADRDAKKRTARQKAPGNALVKFDEATVEAVRRDFAAGIRQVEIANKYGISTQHTWALVHGVRRSSNKESNKA